MLGQLVRGFVAGCAGSAVKSELYRRFHATGLTNLRHEQVSAEEILGKAMVRFGGGQKRMGRVAAIGIGGGLGVLWTVMRKRPHSRVAWIGRGIQLGTITFATDAVLGARQLSARARARVSREDALWHYASHVAAGMVVAGLSQRRIVRGKEYKLEYQPRPKQKMKWWVEVDKEVPVGVM